jgi:hypothetical protein
MPKVRLESVSSRLLGAGRLPRVARVAKVGKTARRRIDARQLSDRAPQQELTATADVIVS